MTIQCPSLSLRRALAGLALAGSLLSATLASSSAARADDIDPEAVAQAQPRPESAAESRSATFQAVSGAVSEDVPGGPLLVAAYGAVLALVIGYVLYLGSLTAGASRDLERLEKTIAGRGEGARRDPDAKG
ncbi:MAG: hypothetical protein OHK0013_22880 [Sandaracinaceae bacterium]